MVGEGGSFWLSYSQPDWAYSGRAMLSYAPPSLKVDLVWGLFEDLGPILGVLGDMVSTI